jgi:hypothetical protein
MINSFRFVTTSTLTAFSSSTGNSSQTTACDLLINQTYYHDGSGTLPIVGDSVYSDSAGSTGLVWNNYKAGIGTYSIQPSGTVVSFTGTCSNDAT